MSLGAMGGIGIGTEGGPAAVLTVLFTDIKGSTALTERLGDERWVEVLSAHDAVVRHALQDHGGWVVKSVGDGCLAVFGSAVSAVQAGVEIQRRISTVPVPGVPGGLQLRVGAHTGAVICANGDVLGRNVHLARRITSAAAPGEVLVSAAVKVVAERTVGLWAGAPRTVRLRGVSEPQVVFDMCRSARPEVAAVHSLADHVRSRSA